MSIRLLQIASLVPLPMIDGGRVGIYHITNQYLKRGVIVDYVAPKANSNDSLVFSKYVNLHLVDIDVQYTIVKGFLNLFSDIPYNIYKYHSLKALHQLEAIVVKKRFDVIQAESLHMAFYAIRLKNKYGIPIVLRQHNFQAEIIRRYCEVVRNPLLKQYLHINYQKMLKYEAKTVLSFDKVFTITNVDDMKLRSISPAVNSVVIPAGVDCEYYNYVPLKFRKSVLFLINYEWIPNVDSFEYYCSEIHPRLLQLEPDTKVIVVGRGTEKIRLSHDLPQIEIKGFIENFNSLSEIAPIAIIPLRIGGGIRIKLLELMAKGFAIVSTSIGAEGVDITHGENILLADTPQEFAKEVARLLRSPMECERIGKNARKLVEEKYSWNVIGDKLYAELMSVLRK